eukprot:tig00020538_g10323.t1
MATPRGVSIDELGAFATPRKDPPPPPPRKRGGFKHRHPKIFKMIPYSLYIASTFMLIIALFTPYWLSVPYIWRHIGLFVYQDPSGMGGSFHCIRTQDCLLGIVPAATTQRMQNFLTDLFRNQSVFLWVVVWLTLHALGQLAFLIIRAWIRCCENVCCDYIPLKALEREKREPKVWVIWQCINGLCALAIAIAYRISVNNIVDNYVKLIPGETLVLWVQYGWSQQLVWGAGIGFFVSAIVFNEIKVPPRRSKEADDGHQELGYM